MQHFGDEKKSISVDELEPGMIIAEKILSEDTVLVNRGVVVTGAIISELKRKYIFYPIEVFIDEDGQIDLVDAIKEKTVEEIEETFKQLSFNIEKIFDNIHLKNIREVEEVQIFAQKIQNELFSARTIIKNIVHNGSGNDEIYRHSVNVAALSALLGKWLGFSEDQINLVTCSAILHDFGKTRIEEGKLKQDVEFKNHPIIGYNIIKEIPKIQDTVLQGILSHHERVNGTGYPSGLKGDKIHPFARIIAIADTFDEINSDWSNLAKRDPFNCLEIIQKDSFGLLDYEYSKIFLKYITNFYISESAILSNNKTAQIIHIDINDIGRPLLLGDEGFIDLKKEKDIFIHKLVI